jgi:NADP-dependent 3-hydroxy acid dehydrogenase YdfG
MPEFAGKVVLVTGASSGIGEGTARARTFKCLWGPGIDAKE